VNGRPREVCTGGYYPRWGCTARGLQPVCTNFWAAPREVCSRSAPNFGLHRERFAAGLHQIFFGYATYYSFPGTCAVRYSQAECHHHLASWEREPEDYIVAAAAGAAGAAC